MNDEQQDKFDRRVRFVAKHYREGALDTDRAWERFASGRGIRRASLVRRYGVWAAAVFLLLVGIGIGFLLERGRPDWVAVATRPGETKAVFLPDSSEITLAGGSEIRYDRKKYGKERRVVEMKGKAFFQVKRVETRPFSVYTSQTVVTVLGTSFQVAENGPLTEVYVETGKVRFAPAEGKKEVILTPGMSAGYSAENREIAVSVEAQDNTLAWKTGRLQFTNTPLEKVIEELNEYYQAQIRNKVPASGLKLTATFDQLPLGEVLMVINQTLDTQLVAATEREKKK